MVIKLWRRKHDAGRAAAKEAIARAKRDGSDLEQQRPEADRLGARLRALRHENHFREKIQAAIEGGQ